MNISIVIPNYNGEHLLRKNLRQVFGAIKDYAEKNKFVEIIVVDDGSSDDSIPFLKHFTRELKKNKKRYVHFIYLENKKNLGFSSTINRGVRVATGEIIVLLNTDVIPEKRFLTKVVQHFQNENVFAVAFMDKSVEKDKTILRGRGIGKWQRGFLMHSRGEVDTINTLWASGGSSAFNKKLWDLLGGLYEVYNPFYWEDIDLSYRALKSGYSIHFDPEIIVTHEHEQGAIRSNFSEKLVKTIAYRNQFFFVWINIADAIFIVQHMIWLPYHLISATLRKDWSFLVGLAQAIKKLPTVSRLRKKNKYVFVLSDKNVLKHFHI